MADKKSVLIINSRPPYGSNAARESLDVALTCGIFDMPISLLFIGDGIYQLLQDQQPAALAQKNVQSLLSSLPMYDIDSIYVCEQGLTQRGLTANDLILPVKCCSKSAQATLLNSHDTVLNF